MLADKATQEQLQKKLESMERMQKKKMNAKLRDPANIENAEFGVGPNEATSQMSSLNQGLLDE